MKLYLKWAAVLTCSVLLLCACSSQPKYEPLDMESVAEDISAEETETEPETEEVIHLVALPDEVYVRVPVNLLKAKGTNESIFDSVLQTERSANNERYFTFTICHK